MAFNPVPFTFILASMVVPDTGSMTTSEKEFDDEITGREGLLMATPTQNSLPASITDKPLLTGTRITIGDSSEPVPSHSASNTDVQRRAYPLPRFGVMTALKYKVETGIVRLRAKVKNPKVCAASRFPPTKSVINDWIVYPGIESILANTLGTASATAPTVHVFSSGTDAGLSIDNVKVPLPAARVLEWVVRFATFPLPAQSEKIGKRERLDPLVTRQDSANWKPIGAITLTVTLLIPTTEFGSLKSIRRLMLELGAKFSGLKTNGITPINWKPSYKLSFVAIRAPAVKLE